MATLSQIRTTVRSYIDESAAKRWSDAELLTFIQFAIQDTANQLAVNGFGPIQQISTLAASDGYLQTQSLNSLRVINVAKIQGKSRINLIPARVMDANQITSVSGDFEITYYKNPTLPSSDSDTVTYGSATYQNNTLDHYCAILAARYALIKDNEQRPDLLALSKQVGDKIKNLPAGPGYANLVSSNNQPNLHLAWIELPHTVIRILNKF